jgi:hypothetical protein
MHGRNSKCGKKVKRQKNRKNNYVCWVKIWKMKCDWLGLAFNNKNRILMWDARTKQWVWEKNKEAEMFEKYVNIFCKNLISLMDWWVHALNNKIK